MLTVQMFIFFFTSLRYMPSENSLSFFVKLEKSYLVIFHFRGAVALDGRIEPGDMILQVNDINFENMSNDEAVRVLREVVQKPG